MLNKLRDSFALKMSLDFLYPEFCVMEMGDCLRSKRNCFKPEVREYVQAKVLGFDIELGDNPNQDPACPSEYALYRFVDTSYPPWANFTQCDDASYPLTLTATFNAPDCNFDFTRLLRFPCNGSRCDLDLTEVTTDCGGWTAGEYTLAPLMPSTQLAIAYTCIPNTKDIGRLGELIDMPFNKPGTLTFDDPSATWPGGIRRPKRRFDPSYRQTLEWYVTGAIHIH